MAPLAALPQPIFGETEKELFPGLVGPLLAAVRARGRCARRPIARWAVAYGVIAVAGFVLSFGPLVRVWGVVVTHHGPYDWLQHVLPGMGGMRAPSRFVVIAILGMSVLIGFGVLLLTERLRPRPALSRSRSCWPGSSPTGGRCRFRRRVQPARAARGSRDRRVAARPAAGRDPALAADDGPVSGTALSVRDAVPRPPDDQRLHRVGVAAPAAAAPSAGAAVRLCPLSRDGDDAAIARRSVRVRPSRRPQLDAVGGRGAERDSRGFPAFRAAARRVARVPRFTRSSWPRFRRP